MLDLTQRRGEAETAGDAKKGRVVDIVHKSKLSQLFTNHKSQVASVFVFVTMMSFVNN